LIKNKLTILTLPGDKGSSFIYSIPITSKAYIYSAPSYSLYQIKSILKSNAIDKIETLYIPASSDGEIKGALLLAQNIPIRTIIFPIKNIKRALFKELNEYCHSHNIEVKFSNIDKNNFTFINPIYQNQIEVSLAETNPGRTHISINYNQNNKDEFFIFNSNLYQLISIPVYP